MHSTYNHDKTWQMFQQRSFCPVYYVYYSDLTIQRALTQTICPSSHLLFGISASSEIIKNQTLITQYDFPINDFSNPVISQKNWPKPWKSFPADRAVTGIWSSLLTTHYRVTVSCCGLCWHYLRVYTGTRFALIPIHSLPTWHWQYNWVSACENTQQSFNCLTNPPCLSQGTKRKLTVQCIP